MMLTRLLPTLAAITVLSACAAQRKPLHAPPPPAPAPAPVATATPAPPPADWRDVPLTPGTWTYAIDAGGSIAAFGPPDGAPLLVLRCEAARGQIVMERAGTAPGSVPLTVVTTSSTRAYTASVAGEALVLAFAPSDPQLDAIAFSRGRFGVEVPGLPALYAPAWPEIGRVIEDCR